MKNAFAMFVIISALLWGAIPGAAQTQASACKAPQDKGLKGPIATGTILVGATVGAERINGGWSQAGSVASDVIYTGGYIITNRDYERSRRYEACLYAEAERVRLASYERVELARLEAQREADRNRTAARAYETATRTGKSGSATAQNGQVSVTLNHNPAGKREGGANNGPLR